MCEIDIHAVDHHTYVCKEGGYLDAVFSTLSSAMGRWCQGVGRGALPSLAAGTYPDGEAGTYPGEAGTYFYPAAFTTKI